MPMTPAQVLEVADHAGRGTGRAMAYSVKRNNCGTTNLVNVTTAQARLLEAAEKAPKPQPPATYTGNPLAAVRPHLNPRRSADPLGVNDRQLTASEIAFLQRLPVDPAAISTTDAERVLQLAADVDNSADSGLIDLIAGPLSDHHARKQAEVDLTNARRPLAELPASTLPALADAIAAETPELAPHEALARATTRLNDYAAAREAKRQQNVATAERRISDLDTRAAGRTRLQPEAPTHPSPVTV